MSYFNKKIIKGRIGEAAEIDKNGAGFAISYKQFDGFQKVPCYISRSRTELFNNVAGEYLHEGNTGKEITVIGTDVYSENSIILMAEEIYFSDDAVSKKELNKVHIDFSDE